MAAVDVVDSYLAALPADARRVAHTEWGLTLQDVAGGPLDVGVRIADELVRAQAFAAPFDEHLDPWMVLWWNRQTRMVRFSCDRSRSIWVHADLPVSEVDEGAIDRLLGLVTEAVAAVRDYAARSRSR